MNDVAKESSELENEILKMEEGLARQKPQFEKGRLYQFNGHEFVVVEPSEVLKTPLTEEAMDAVKGVRKAATELMNKRRPDLIVVASAMLLAAAQHPHVAMQVKEYGQIYYS